MQAWPATASWPSARFQRRRIHLCGAIGNGPRSAELLCENASQLIGGKCAT